MAAWAPPLSLVHVQEVTGECSWGQQEGKWAEGTQGCSAVSAKPPENPQELCPGTDLWGCQEAGVGWGSPVHPCTAAQGLSSRAALAQALLLATVQVGKQWASGFPSQCPPPSPPSWWTGCSVEHSSLSGWKHLRGNPQKGVFS